MCRYFTKFCTYRTSICFLSCINHIRNEDVIAGNEKSYNSKAFSADNVSNVSNYGANLCATQ